jgi:hypothetical protein
VDDDSAVAGDIIEDMKEAALKRHLDRNVK